MQAKYQCGKIYPDAESKEFQACVLSISNAVSARMASDLAAEQAAAAITAQRHRDSPVNVLRRTIRIADAIQISISTYSSFSLFSLIR